MISGLNWIQCINKNFKLTVPLKICEEYAEIHNLRFSTDRNPDKCKTKCLAFFGKNPQPLVPLQLCGNPLPWVSSAKHLGMTLDTSVDGMKSDLKIKRAEHISKNIEILQEFGFSHPRTKIMINNVYNSHLSGSCLWDLFSKEAVQMENSWNVSMRLMLDLPRETHRRLIEPLSEVTHAKILMIKRFLTFLQQIQKSTKTASKFLLETILQDTRSTTGSNLRNIFLLTNNSKVRELEPNDAISLNYNQISDDEKWKIPIIQELIEMKNENLDVENFRKQELDEILERLCVL